jgi:hypothetical protein
VVVCCGRILRSGRRLDCSAPFFWSHNGRATKAEPGEKRDTAKTSITIGADSQKVLDLTTPNREEKTTTAGILLCAGWVPHFRVFVWGCLGLGSGVDFIRHIGLTRVPHRSPVSIFVQQQMTSIFRLCVALQADYRLRALLWEQPPARSPTRMRPFPGQWR